MSRPKGKANIGADERFTPSIRQVAVARAYVQGLEDDRLRLKDTEERLTHTTWEAIQLGMLNRALVRLLGELLNNLDAGKHDPDLFDRIENLLEDSRHVTGGIFECECGHSVYDHDERGCLYMGCKPICGRNE